MSRAFPPSSAGVDADVRARGRVDERVLDENARDLERALLVRDRDDGQRRVHFELVSALERNGGELRCCRLRHLVQGHDGPVEVDMARVEP